MWLIELAGTSFADAIAQPTAAPYIDTQAVPAGTLLSGWSALDGGAFANETALLASEPPLLSSARHDRPAACPEGAAGASCTSEAGALSAADEFLKATVPTITSAAAFRESGLIVVTFASVGVGHRDRPARRRCDRDAHHPATRGRAADLAVRVRRRALVGDVQPDFTEAEPRKAPAAMTDPSTNERRPPLHLIEPAHRKATWWLAAIVGFVALLLAIPAVGHAEEPNPNNYNCIGKIAAGEPEAGNEEQQVQYAFYCNGPITGYQLQSQIPVTGIEGQPVVTSNATAKPLSQTFSCSGEFPGYAPTASAWPSKATRRSPGSSRSARSSARSRASIRC